MRRVMLLALLALGVPTAALATSIDFSTGTFVSGTFGGSFTSMVHVSVVGSMNTITFNTGTLTPTSCFPGSTCYTFTTGSVRVASGGSTLFTGALSGGFVIRTGNSVSINAGLVPNSMISRGSASTSFTHSGINLTSGTAGVSAVATAEPGTLGMLGTGLIGLAGLARRKLKL